jgi:hypothetical protein
MAIDYKRWFDRTQPQTLQIAMLLLYLNGFFALVSFLEGDGDWVGVARVTKGGVGALVGLAVIAAHAFGGLLMANGRRLGWYLGLAAAFSPVVLRFWVLSGSNWSFQDKLFGTRIISFLFEAALVALLLHTQSREYQKTWYR